MVGRSRAFFVVALAAFAVRVGAAQVSMPRLAGDGEAVEQGASLHARDADSRLVLWLLARDGGRSFVAVGGAPLTGTATARNRAAIFSAISGRPGVTVVHPGAGSSKSKVNLDVPAISGRALLERLAASAGAKGVVIARDVTLGEVSVSLRGVPVDAALAALETATGTRIVTGRDLLFVLPKDQALAELPSKSPALFSLRIAGATAAQTLATLEAAGVAVEGRVPCEAGEPIWIDASEVGADEALRAIRLASGAGDAIGNGDACRPKTWSGAPSLAGATPLAVVRAGPRAVALVQIAGETWLVPQAALPKGTRLVSGPVVVLGPAKSPKPPRDTTLSAWKTPGPAANTRTVVGVFAAADIERATLTATVLDPRRKGALLLGATGTVVVPANGVVEGRAYEIGDGTVVLARTEGGRFVLPAGAPGFVDPPEVPAPPPPDAGGARPDDDANEESTSTPAPELDRLKKKESETAASEIKSVVSSANRNMGLANDPAAPASAPPPPRETESDRRQPERNLARKDSFALTAIPASPLWAVEPFGEKPGWLGAHQTSLAASYRGDSWGDTFALALETALRERGRRAQAVDSKLTDVERRKLVQTEALRYVLGGEIRTLTVDASKLATLTVAVNVRKESGGGKFKLVDLRTHPGSTTLGASVATEAELLELLRVTAGKAADAVVESLPHDLFAVRN